MLGVRPMVARWNLVGRAVGIDDDGVGDVL